MTKASDEYRSRFRTWVTLVVQYVGNTMARCLGKGTRQNGKVEGALKGFEKGENGYNLARHLLAQVVIGPVFMNLAMNDTELAQLAMKRIEELGRISEETGRLTRTFGSPAMRKANGVVAGRMRE